MFLAHCAIAVLFIIDGFITEAQDEVRFVSVVFRHGDRTPQSRNREMYPNDPNIDNDFYPMGLGALTNKGKLRAYELGEELRKRYNVFLGDDYISEELYAISTDVERTKMSLSLVLAALYPPSEKQRWQPTLNWQPIPYKYLEKPADNLFGALHACPKFREEYKKVIKTPGVIKLIKEFSRLKEKLKKLTGKKMENIADLSNLYHGLIAETAMGLKIPSSVDKVLKSDQLYNAAKRQYEIGNYNNVLKKANSGLMLKMLIDDMNNAKNGTQYKRKISLYSGHEWNVASLLIALGMYEKNPHVPGYSSAVIIELVHRDDDQYYVKVVYSSGNSAPFKELEIPNCGKLCPLATFIDNVKDVTSTGDMSECRSYSRDRWPKLMTLGESLKKMCPSLCFFSRQ